MIAGKIISTIYVVIAWAITTFMAWLGAHMSFWTKTGDPRHGLTEEQARRRSTVLGVTCALVLCGFAAIALIRIWSEPS